MIFDEVADPRWLADTGGPADPPRLARIPPTWRLQVYAGDGVGFLRLDVRREASVGSVEAGLRDVLPMHHGKLAEVACPPRVELWEGATVRLDPEASVEASTLFTRRGGLSARLLACSEEEEAAASAWPAGGGMAALCAA